VATLTDRPAIGHARSLILVRNAVTHDARVLREAATLRDLDYDVLIAGVVSTAEPATETEIQGFRVLRLAPGRPLRRVRHHEARRPAPMATAPGTPGAAAALARPGAAPAPPGAAPATPHPARRALAAARRLAVTADYYRQGITLVRRTRPALVHANDYNTMWIGIAAKLLAHSRLVYDSHELWADRNGRPEWRPWLIACEAVFVRVADAVVTASPGYAAALAARYRVAPPTVVRNIPAGAPRPARPASAGGRTAVYIGGLMPGRGLEQAIAALALVPEARLRLVGPGGDAYRRSLTALAAQTGVAERVTIEDPVAPGAVTDTIADAGVGLMLIQPICRSYELTLPNKLFEYAAAGLPILASDLAVMGPLVREHGLGEAVAPADVAQIAAAIRRLLVPEANAGARERVRAYARAVGWEGERAVLAGVYAG
jgi:glycosyltransferase involved in cell wall biosynthesis